MTVNYALIRNHTRATLSEQEQSAIADHIRTHGVRRFEAGFTSDPQSIKARLFEHGYEMMIDAGYRSFRLKKIGAKGKPRRVKLRDLVALLDQHLAAEGKPTIYPSSPNTQS